MYFWTHTQSSNNTTTHYTKIKKKKKRRPAAQTVDKTEDRNKREKRKTEYMRTRHGKSNHSVNRKAPPLLIKKGREKSNSSEVM